MPDIGTFADSLLFRLQSLGWVDILDLILVTAAIYILMQLLRRSQAAFVLRAVLVLAGLLLLANVLLPLPTFGIFLTFAALAVVVTLPIVLQPELRRWLERFGRRLGFSFSGQESLSGTVIPEITRAAESLSSSKTGALIVIEGSVPLTEIIDSGIRVDGQVTAELLQTIFANKTPLHDGAAVIREDVIVAAGCVLPLTDRQLQGRRRLGTRHRAAVGITEASDALAVVVSEETGAISVALNGKLTQGLDRTSLHKMLSDFYAGTDGVVARRAWRPWQNWHMPGPRALVSDLLTLMLAFLLALVATTAVRLSNDPITPARQEGVLLQVEGLTPDMTLAAPLPRTVAVQYEAPESQLPSVGASTFQAVISITETTTGLARLPVEVTTTASRVNVLSAVPAEVDVQLAANITRTMPVTVRLVDQDRLSSAYEIYAPSTADPAEVVVNGPEPFVNEVTAVEAVVSVANATARIEEERPMAAINADGVVVSEVDITPPEADITVYVRRRINAREVGVRVITEGSPPEEYWLSGLIVEPASVTIVGNPSTIAELGSFVDTVPVDLTNAVGELVAEVPLQLPGDVQAVDSEGNLLTNVTVTAQVSARSSDLLTERPVELINDRGTLTITVEPPDVELLLSGPLPTLNAIEAQPDLVRVVIDALQLRAGESVEVFPEVLAPPDVRAQLIDTSVLVTTEP